MQPINGPRQLSKFISRVFSPHSLTELLPTLQPKTFPKKKGWGRWQGKEENKKAVLKQTSEKARERTCWPKVLSPPPVAFHAAQCAEVGGRAASWADARMFANSPSKRGRAILVVARRGVLQSSRLPARPTHAHRAGKEKKAGPKKDAFWITCARLLAICCCISEHCRGCEGGRTGPSAD